MATQPLTRITIRASHHALEVLGVLFLEVGVMGIEEDEGCIKVYAESAQQLAELEETLNSYVNSVASTGDGGITWDIEPLDDAWDSVWKQALLPQQITPTFTVRPTHCPPGPPSENTLWFEPETTFGSGEHATTRLAAVALERHLQENPGLRFLDVGTGTGVLAFIAARTGAGRAVGIDTDEVAVRSARRNAELNQLSGSVEIVSGSADALSETFEVVVANINTPILVRNKSAICARVAPRGTLFLTGLLDDDVDEVIAEYATEGVELEVHSSDDGWSLLRGARAI